MKLLLSDKEIAKALEKQPIFKGRDLSFAVDAADRLVAQAQLNHIFNLDAKTTSEVIVKLEAHLDKLYLKEMAK